MILVIDAVGNRFGGGLVVLREFLSRISRVKTITRVHVFVDHNEVVEFCRRADTQVQWHIVAGVRGGLGRLAWAACGIDRCLRRISCDAFIGLNGIGPVSSSVPSFLFVQQALPFSSEALSTCRFSARLRMLMLKLLFRRSALHAMQLFVQTPAMRHALRSALRLPSEKINVFLPGAPSAVIAGNQMCADRRSNPGKRMIYVGNDEPYKNLKVVKDGAALLCEVIKIEYVATLTPASYYVQSGPFIGVGRIEHSRIGEFYLGADVLVMPSLIESLGLPMLEAMAAGVPVLAADRPYAHDVCGDAALYFDPHSPRDFARKAETLLRDPDLCARQVARGREIVAALDAADPYRAMIEKTIEVARAARLASSARNLHGRSFTS